MQRLQRQLHPPLSSRPEQSAVERFAVSHIGAKARQIWGTLDWWRFWVHASSRFSVGRPRPLAEQASQEICGLCVRNRGAHSLCFTLTRMWKTADLSTSLRSR